MHTCYEQSKIHDIRWFDTVIPNYFDMDEFPIVNEGKGQYLAFLGRLIQRKGPHIASDIAKAAGLPLRVAGAGGKQVGKDIIANEVTIKDAEYIGPVNVKERAQFLAGARALIVPTTYMEPFGGVAVEAMLCGTPVIASDAGAFTEIVKNGVSGYRFRTLTASRGRGEGSRKYTAADDRRIR
jgi:glycosyltransferase involved in cell wall biosynthesis